jgi:hypothetical protein
MPTPLVENVPEQLYEPKVLLAPGLGQSQKNQRYIEKPKSRQLRMLQMTLQSVDRQDPSDRQ